MLLSLAFNSSYYCDMTTVVLCDSPWELSENPASLQFFFQLRKQTDVNAGSGSFPNDGKWRQPKQNAASDIWLIVTLGTFQDYVLWERFQDCSSVSGWCTRSAGIIVSVVIAANLVISGMDSAGLRKRNTYLGLHSLKAISGIV